MVDQKEIFFTRLDERRTQLGLSDRALSLKAGASQDLIRTARGKWHIPSSSNLTGIAKVLGVTTDWLLGRDDNPGVAIPSDARVREQPLEFRPRRDRDDLPVLGTGHCGTITLESGKDKVQIEQTLFEPTTVIRYVTRPLALMGIEDAYAIYFVGESMAPRFRPGGMGIVFPRKPAANGDDVIVQLRGENSDEIVSVLVKTLIKRTSEYIELEQYNPPLTFRIETERVARVHRIMDMAELLGG